jgi:putative SOS response-associated peptidase YedK
MPDGGDAFTLLTTEPGPDVAPIHNRQVVVLPRDDWRAWLFLERPEAELLRPLPSGRLIRRAGTVTVESLLSPHREIPTAQSETQDFRAVLLTQVVNRLQGP